MHNSKFPKVDTIAAAFNVTIPAARLSPIREMRMCSGRCADRTDTDGAGERRAAAEKGSSSRRPLPATGSIECSLRVCVLRCALGRDVGSGAP
jgi:hypothetical protein